MKGGGGSSPGGDYERHRGAVLGMLAKRFPRIDEDDRLAIYHDAWTRVYVKRERGERIDSLRAYLLATAGAEALNLLTRSRVPMPLGPDDPRIEALADGAPPVDEQVATRDQARIARGLLDTLDARQRDVLKLRWDLQLSGSEVRAALGLSERQYRRLAEEGAAAIAGRVEELQSGRWSRRTRSLLVACLIEVTQDGKRRVGIASPRQRKEAQRLLETDPHVAALFAEVKRSIRGVAALLPLPVLAVAPANGSLAQLLSDARSQAADAIETVRLQSTSLYLRAADPTLLSGGPRPGAAALAVTGAIALGGGAYGTHELVSTPGPPSPPERAAQPAAQDSGAVPAARAPRTPNVRPDPAPTPRPEPTPQPDVTLAPISVPPPAPPVQASPAPSPPSPPTPTDEFGFEN
jgi:RNA polymerase sigma factor (sigma-70 family)